MEVKNIDNERIVKFIEVNPDNISNQDHFEADLKQVVEHYTCILDEKEIREFTENVFKKVFGWRK